MKKEIKGLGNKIWERNFYAARRFFESKGNVMTRSRLKDKWFKEFKNNIEELLKYMRCK